MISKSSSQSKIDAAEGLVRYVNTIKPFHSKLLDVLIEYIYKEDIRVKVTEKWNTDINQFHTTGGVSWDESSQSFVATGSACYFQIVDHTVTQNGAGTWDYTWDVAGHHAEKFLAGNRFLVTLADGSSKIFITVSAQNVSGSTTITTLPITAPVSPSAQTIQLAITPDYRIVAAVTGPNGFWIVEGDQRDQFQAGETVLVTTETPASGSIPLFTISGAPTVGFTTQPAVSGNQIPDHTPDFAVIGVKPTHQVTTDPDPAQWHTVTGQWAILGHHAASIISGTQLSVSNDPSASGFYTVASVVDALYDDLTDFATQANASYLYGHPVTIITIVDSEIIPETALPSGTIQSPVIPLYEIISVTPAGFTIAGQYATRFQTGAFFVVDNTTQSANGGYFIESATDNPDGTTLILVTGGTQGATATGIIQHPTVPCTYIPVQEPVFDHLNAQGIFYTAQRTGTLRYTPRVFTQPTQPVSPVFGSIWINPVTNVSKRYNGTWIHNYTPTNYSWFLDVAPPASLIIKSATAPTPSPAVSTHVSVDMPIFATTALGSLLTVGDKTLPIAEIIDPHTASVDGDWFVPQTGTVFVQPYLHTSTVHRETVSVRQPHTFVVGDFISYNATTHIWTKSLGPTSSKVTSTPDTTRFTFTTTDHITPQAGTVISATDTDTPIYGLPEEFTITNSERVTAALDPDYYLSNSFLVQTASRLPYTFTTISTKSNELMFSTPYTTVAVDPIANTWTVSGILSDDDLIPGENFFVTSSTTGQGLGQYTVASVAAGTTPNTTVIQAVKQISRLATAGGILAVPARTADLPNWVEGTKVMVSSTSSLPDPLVASVPYYFIPVIAPYSDAVLDASGNTITRATVETPPTFALSTVRTPRDYNDFVDITTFGNGTLSIIQAETYVPGTKIKVRDSYNSRNDGEYTILQSSTVSPTTERIYVTETVKSTTPVGMSADGVIVYDLDSHLRSSLTQKVCKAREQSMLHAGATVTEHIEFTFTVDEFDFIMATLAENAPQTEFLRDLGFDVPDYDEVGYDGGTAGVTEMTPMWGSSAYAHSMMQIGFDTQYFDMGGIDETTQSVAKKYGKPGR